MSLRYIGSKARLVDAIVSIVGEPGRRSGRFVDAFCGTGAVAEAAARLGWSIHLNDHLACAVTLAYARLVSNRSVRFRSLGGYEKAVQLLNETKPERGFIWREYSPASAGHVGITRMYFTEKNAARIDSIRQMIAQWRRASLISKPEERLLIGDLLLATNRIANIAGTYGCFLSHWSPQSQGDLVIPPRTLFPNHVHVTASVLDVEEVDVMPNDLVYLDPPYTKRQYAAYYHILETITRGDEPQVAGVTGLRPWRDKASHFCYRTRALRTLLQLIQRQAARRVLLSYSNQGHLDLDALSRELSRLGQVSVLPLKEIGRYRPNRAAHAAASVVSEYLLIINRQAQTKKQMAFA